ncbi:MAG: hypothetical protein MUC42_08285 [Bryobacter sp.]|nr:hypothetical protein [Bryobacter sp.]
MNWSAPLQDPAVRRWLSLGSGVGIELDRNSLRAMIVRIRPKELSVSQGFLVENFREHPAAEWGAEYAKFLALENAAHLAAMVILPRDEVILRTISLPGVAPKDLPNAVAFQMDGLHPWAEEDAVTAWSPLTGANSVLVAAMRRDHYDRYLNLFQEAGIKIAGFTTKAAATYGALRFSGPAPGEVLTVEERPEGTEIYGESPARPLYSVIAPATTEHLLTRARAELRIAPETPAVDWNALLPAPGASPVVPEWTGAYAAALSAATPLFRLPFNLLPESLRVSSSRLRLVPTAVLAGLLALLGTALAFESRLENQRLLDTLRGEIARLETQARRAPALDRDIMTTRAQLESLAYFKQRTKLDLDTMAELTRIIAPPGWASMTEITAEEVMLSGEAEQATNLLQQLDASPLFASSEFAAPLSPSPQKGLELFRIRMKREKQPRGPAAGGVK